MYLARITSVNVSAQEVQYHAYCRIKYQTEAERKVTQMRRLAGKDTPTEDSASVWHKTRKIDKKLFETLVSYLEEIVFKKKGVLLLAYIIFIFIC